MKKAISILIPLLIVLSFAGCGKKVQGASLIENARSDYQKSDSAEVTVTDEETNTVMQKFVFMIDDKDVMHFSNYELAGSKVTKEYFDGEKYIKNVDGEITILKKGENKFPNYSRKVRNLKATKNLIVYEPDSVKTSVESSNGDGSKSFTYNYNPEKIKYKDINGKITSFVVVYNFDKDGNLLNFIEKSTVKPDNSEETTHSYIITIANMNAVKDIKNEASR